MQFQTPGFAETATAESRVLQIAETGISQDDANTGVTPTYTAPAEIVALQATRALDVQLTPVAGDDLLNTTLESIATGNIPPLLPIAGLLLLGTLGLLISSMRR